MRDGDFAPEVVTLNWGKHAAFGAWFAISIGTLEGSHKNAASPGLRLPMDRQKAFRGRPLPGRLVSVTFCGLPSPSAC
ncbi:hypothetical protein [Streptomyces sp. NPDC058683]|uniref:hypothetical protein n=1 Tax=Streptomyces sp. NPDC058683 TaxID=3346597 RepID=UPI003651CCEB